MQGKITVFKSLALSKIIHLALVKTIPKNIIEQLNKIQKEFIWNNLKAKIKNSVLCADYKDGGMKNVNIENKIISLQCSWIKRMYDDNIHDWKIIPSAFISKYLGKNFKFHSNIDITFCQIKKFPKYYQEIIKNWSHELSCKPITPSAILSQFLWFNSQIVINSESFFFTHLADKGTNFVRNLYNIDGKLKAWNIIKDEFSLNEKHKFQWMQIVNSLPKQWKETIKQDNGNSNNLIIQDHHLIKNHQILCLEKLESKELYIIQLSTPSIKPTSQRYFENLFERIDFDWANIYVMPRLLTLDSRLRAFQYKILHNVLYLNKQLFKFQKVNSPLGSFCNQKVSLTQS